MTLLTEHIKALGLTNQQVATLVASTAHQISAARTGRYCSEPLAEKLSRVLEIDAQPCGSWKKKRELAAADYTDFTAETDYPYTCEVCGAASFRERCVRCYAMAVPSQAETDELADHTRSDAKRAYDREYHQAQRRARERVAG